MLDYKITLEDFSAIIESKTEIKQVFGTGTWFIFNQIEYDYL
jgi:hypothetical protein